MYDRKNFRTAEAGTHKLALGDVLVGEASVRESVDDDFSVTRVCTDFADNTNPVESIHIECTCFAGRLQPKVNEFVDVFSVLIG